MNKVKLWFGYLVVLITAMCSGCQSNSLVDLNMAMPHRNWSYVNKVKTIVEIKDPAQAYSIYFRLRHTASYSYSNVFILFHLKGSGQKAQVKRYEYRLALDDGQWLGSGSGNLFTYNLPLLTNYHFPAAGRYEMEIEQNMRDNPLKEISDAGINVTRTEVR